MATTAPVIMIANPGVQNANGMLTVMIPIINTTSFRLDNLLCTRVWLGTAAILSPPALPLSLGHLGKSNSTSLVAKFSSSGLAIGSTLSLNLHFTYTNSNGVTQQTSANRNVAVPPVSAPAQQFLRARLLVQPGNTNTPWRYTIVNDEPPSSSQWVTSFALTLAATSPAPVAPVGWSVETDASSYVLWASGNPALPNSNQVGPGSSLAGFTISQPPSSTPLRQGSPFVLTAWDRAKNSAGLVTADYTIVPK